MFISLTQILFSSVDTDHDSIAIAESRLMTGAANPFLKNPSGGVGVYHGQAIHNNYVGGQSNPNFNGVAQQLAQHGQATFRQKQNLLMKLKLQQSKRLNRLRLLQNRANNHQQNKNSNRSHFKNQHRNIDYVNNLPTNGKHSLQNGAQNSNLKTRADQVANSNGNQIANNYAVYDYDEDYYDLG